MEIMIANKFDLERIVELNKLFHLDFPRFIWDTEEYVSEEIKRGNYFILKNHGETVAAMCLH
jgi:hypothetical protein